MGCFFVFSLIISLLTPSWCEELASFYGSSYISVPLQEAYANNDIELQFRTWLPDALLLLVAGRTDFCMLQLEAGSIKLRINLGAGEKEISSPDGYSFDDGEWHKVVIVRREGNLTMKIDEEHTVRTHLPGPFFELNIQFGVFVGGDGHFKEQFLGHMVGFRGCISDLLYAGTNLLPYARRRQGNSKVYGVSWNCAAEFDTDVTSEISFVEDDAFITLSHSIGGRAGSQWQLELLTTNANSIILYNSGQAAHSHMIALEVVEGKLLLILNNPKVTKLENPVKVSDGSWHKIVVQFTPGIVELTVDATMSTAKVTGSKFLDLSEIYYIGGLELSQRTRAIVRGVKTADSSFKGCLRGFAVNGEKMGLPNAKSTFGIKSGSCVSLNVQNKSAIDLNIISTSPIKVTEEHNTSITVSNIHIIVDYPSWGMRDNAVWFKVLRSPNGAIINSDGMQIERFTFLDVLSMKVGYLHDGSEISRTELVLEIRFGENIMPSVPQYLHRSWIFSVPVEVTLTNDPPTVKTGLLRIAKGTRKVLSANMLNATDPDNHPSDIIYTVPEPDLTKLVKSIANLIGQFEYSDQPRKAIFRFTQDDVNAGRVVFAHFGPYEDDVDMYESAQTKKNQTEYVSVDVSDGLSINQTIVLMIAVYDLEIIVRNNRGLMMIHNTSALIQGRDLSFVINVDDENISNNIKIDVVEQPQFGLLECEKDKKYWELCDWFLSGEIYQKRVRYRHTVGTPVSDEFKFRASVNKINSRPVYNFSIIFVTIEFERLNSQTVLFNRSLDTIITNEQIYYQTQPITSANKYIKYHITKLPKYGDITLNNKRLDVGMIWTQSDIDRHNLKYTLHRKSFSVINDSINFKVSTKNCRSVLGNLQIKYFPSKEMESRVKSVLLPLQVFEGEKANIGISHFDVKIDSESELPFNITERPKHGSLQICKQCLDPKKCLANETICRNSTLFSSEDIRRGYIYYIHDDSESRIDNFTFITVSVDNDFQFVGFFRINVVLKNDNTPKRIINKVFQVVVNQSKVITSRDLRYVDDDIDTRVTDIVYTCQSSTNGNIYSIKTAEKVTSFTQDDINKEKLFFKHSGEEYGKLSLWITDGKFFVDGLLEIHAGKAFVKIVTGDIIVQSGKSLVFNSNMLNVETNLNMRSVDIKYKVVKSVANGVIKHTNKNEPLLHFTQHDIDTGQVTYIHDVPKTYSDAFILHVMCRNASMKAEIPIRILPTEYWLPLLPSPHVEDLVVEESTSVVISKRNLQIVNTGIPSHAIIYTIISKPQNGYLRLSSSKSSNQLHYFDQSMVDKNQIQYIQNIANQTSDIIVFNVTNGIIFTNDIMLNIKIIPDHFYISTKILNVSEGGDVVIVKDSIEIVTDYYAGSVEEYSVVRQPKHGFVQIGSSTEHVTKFTQRDIDKGFVKYVHDGSENFEDKIIIIGYVGTRESVPATIPIIVLPVNDHSPDLVNNTGLQMWEGGCAVISNSRLGAIDEDVPPEEIAFKVTANWWGNTVLYPDMVVVQSFTQKQLEDGHVFFNHTNGTIAKFTFRLTDGIHNTKEHTFVIETKPISLLLLNNGGLHVFPLNRKAITSSHLRATTSDSQRDVLFHITKSPTLGRIVVEIDNGGFYTVEKFMQSDVDRGRVFYEHTHPFDSLYANDSFIFSAEAKLASPLIDQIFNIDISVSSGGLDSYVTITPLTVDEGGSGTISLNVSRVATFLETHVNLPAPIIHATAKPPAHGIIYSIEGPNNTNTFTRSQFDEGLIKYQHDHSDTLTDLLYFTLYLIPEYITLCNVSIPVKIIPINDQSFKLITQAPSMSVVYGENATITREHLLTEDPDTPPEQLEYDVITEPSEGRIVILPDVDMSGDKGQVGKFTQKDIDDGKVVYKHSGSNSTVTFYFRVWDGKFKPVYMIFNIQIIPVSIELSSGTPLYIQQGQNVATLTLQHIHLKTNVDPSRIYYNITRLPSHGVIYVSDSPGFSFTHNNLRSGLIMYMQTDMTTANDTFRISAFVDSVSVSDTITIFMLVQPLMQRGNFTALLGRANKVGLKVLNANPLAELTSSNPVYDIVRRPTFGTINKIIRNSGDHEIVYDDEVDRFTHEELRSGLIFYVAREENSLDGIEDLFVFLLSGSIFQPAYGELRFKIISDKIEPELKRHRGGMRMASPNMSSDYVPIIVMLLGVLVLGISVIAIIKCRSVSPLKEEPAVDTVQPVPLPRPPDHLMAPTPHLKRYISEELALPTPISVPHCKVTPLGPVESSLASSELDMHSRYPYGSAEDGTTIVEDWCSHDAPSDSSAPRPGTANPLLRRNQYWV